MKEVTYEDWVLNPTPRMMWVWDNTPTKGNKRRVVCILKEGSLPVVAVDKYDRVVVNWKHCAEIEEPKKRRMTQQELAWWLMDGIKEGKHREYKHKTDMWAYPILCYNTEKSNQPVDDNILIRENGGEWREPLVEVEE